MLKSSVLFVISTKSKRQLVMSLKQQSRQPALSEVEGEWRNLLNV
jgi:cell division protein FtsL